MSEDRIFRTAPEEKSIMITKVEHLYSFEFLFKSFGS